MSIIDLKIPAGFLKRILRPEGDVAKEQQKVLKKLLKKARFTEFGQAYGFDDVLFSSDVVKKFKENVPLHDYNTLYNNWWHKALEGKPDVCWPGKIAYFALSSGTSEAASKYIPITKNLLAGNQVAMIKQLLSLRNYKNLRVKSLSKGWLAFSGSTDLQKGDGYYAGDLSGITSRTVPIWFQPFFKPGKKIARERDWNKKIENIVEQAPNWDIGFILGVPSWIQMCLEMIIKKYKLNNIHDIWPNLAFYVHGGVCFEPYKKKFETLLGKPINYIETYLASEGFIAYQNRQFSNGGMKLVIGQHLFFEFIPFNNDNFNDNGDLKGKPETLTISEVEENKDYAIVISSAAGAWRYLLGDTIKFTDKSRSEIVITGRIKHFLSLVGEHLSVDNMNKAIQLVCEELQIDIPEYTVAGIPHGDFFAHHWYLGTSANIDAALLSKKIDEKLHVLNDDYAVERKSTLKEVIVTKLPENKFIEFLEQKGRLGAQNKFPRVLKGGLLRDWELFLNNN
ncbi:GH3 auxin-responsive promoter family protein [Haoranjiania flava]|uniref:GH3 auxin-responsive promoter family protein n=1 Tax=Haoranjiania flava TaxID=1856322 RepID=A0AAE3LJR0_9BACT|nr:GH3 auxin-responsive promoter family protein [Haoranjiania flava]MCU7694017.1 GH3 auxin-responsive promoter family protein [Haoranjiania flava]